MAASAAQAETPLYPNLKTLSPRDLRFDRADADPGSATVMHNVLRFSNTVWDSGPGRLEMRGQIDPTTKSGPAVQRVYSDSGGFTDFAAGSFYYHPAHQHYHYDNWGRYELWTKAGYEAWLASGRTQGSPTLGSKTTSCMIDEEFIRNVPNQPYPPPYDTGGCFPDSGGRMLQGISPGWGDTYDYYRFEQWIDLGASGSLANGQYVLRSVADPLNKIYESPGKADVSRESQEDNEAIVEFAVQGGKLVDSNPPSGSVRINDVDAATASPNVVVKVLGRDDISGVAAVRLSNDGSAWSAAQPYTGRESTAQAIAWNLADPAYGGVDVDGTKTVYAEFRDATGKWSPPETDTIVLDRAGGSSPYSNAVLSDGPSGYWRLGEASGTTASDSAAANPGTYRNGPSLGEASLLPADPANRAVGLDGADDYVYVPSASSLSPPSRLSIEAWIKPAALPGSGGFASIVSKPGSYSLQFDGSRLEFAIVQPGGTRRLQAPVGAVQAGHVYHVVGTYDDSFQRLYVNDVEVASTGLGGQISTSDEELGIGSWSEGSELFHGVIDEAAVYTAALSAARVDAHYQAATGGEPPDRTVDDPSGLSATAASETEVDLHWADNSSNEGEFLIERDTDSGFGSPTIESAWANSTVFTDVGLSPATTYYYRVRARNATDSSGYSNVASATTLQSETASAASSLPSTSSSPAAAGGGVGYAAAVMNDDPVGYWRLDELSGEAALDAQGANPGAYRDDPRLGQPGLLASDPLDRSVRFDGGGDRVDVPSADSLRPATRVSAEAWIRPTALPRAGKVALIAGRPGSYSIELYGSRLEFTIGGAGSRLRLRTRPGAIAVDRAYHLVGTYDGDTQRLFVNGVRVASAPRSGRILAGKRDFEIGGTGASARSFRGIVDEVAVYARALSAARVGAHYRAAGAARQGTARRAWALRRLGARRAAYLGYCHIPWPRLKS